MLQCRLLYSDLHLSVQYLKAALWYKDRWLLSAALNYRFWPIFVSNFIVLYQTLLFAHNGHIQSPGGFSYWNLVAKVPASNDIELSHVDRSNLLPIKQVKLCY